ncbi:biotin/lipoyl-containing protein, partial [Trueperella sp.]|uniref:biotin/lipoyl-containing protein n=1 Tax=Trueperella sp. TaxID=2699835 RepID=UPI00261228BC
MSEPIKMPALGESIDEGTVTTWLKNVGDTVEADEPIVEVSTDKVDTEVPAPAAGVLESIEVGEDETVSVGTVLGYIGDGSGAGAPAQSAPAEAPAPVAPAPAEAPAPAAPAAPAASGPGVEVTMPALGESVDEGTVTTWLKQVGDEVEEDEPIVEVSTDKVDTEVPAPAAGILTEIKVGEDETVSVGTVLAIIGGEAPAAPKEEPKAEPAPAPAAPAPAAPAPAAPAPAPAPAVAVPAAPADGKSAYVTPIVRKLAKDLGVDLEAISGT